MKTPLKSCFPCVFAAALASPSDAALLAYDGFKTSVYNAVPSGSGGGYRDPSAGPSDALFYDDNTVHRDGSTEVGQSPAVTGFAGAWDYTSNIGSHVYARLEQAQQNYSDGSASLLTGFGQLNLFRASGSGGAKGFSRALNVGPSTNFTSTIYIGGLLQRTSDTSFTLRMSSTDGTNSRPFQMTIGEDGATTLSGGTIAGTATSSLGGLWAVGVTEFFVLKLENSVDNSMSSTDGDRMSLFINPELGDESANTPDLVLSDPDANYFVTANSGWTLGDMRISSGLSATGQSVVFDEFRIATTWAELVAVPEPSGALLPGLAALAALAAGLRRRR